MQKYENEEEVFSQISRNKDPNYSKVSKNISSYNNETTELEISTKSSNFKEKFQSLLSESYSLGLILSTEEKNYFLDNLPENESKFHELITILNEKYFNAALALEKEILPSSIDNPEHFLKQIQSQKGRSSKDIFILSQSKYNFGKLGFKFESFLGAGAFGEAWKCSIQSEELKNKYNSEVAAIKFQLDKQGSTSSAQEFALMSGKLHPNVVKLYDFLLIYNALIMELCPEGSLLSFLEKQTQSIPMSLLFKFAIQLSGVLVFLHEKSIFHRDVRLTNILLDSEFNIKLADFGIAIIQGVQVNKAFEKLMYVGKNIYSEIGTSDPRSVDIKFFGIVLLKLLHFGENVKKCGEDGNIESWIPDWCPPIYKKFITFCLNSNPYHFNDKYGMKFVQNNLFVVKSILSPSKTSQAYEPPKSKKEIETLISNLSGNNWDLRNISSKALSLQDLSQDTNILQQIVRNLTSKNKYLVSFASKILYNQNLSENKNIIYELMQLLINPDETIRTCSANILSNQDLSKNSDAMKELENILNSKKLDEISQIPVRIINSKPSPTIENPLDNSNIDSIIEATTSNEMFFRKTAVKKIDRFDLSEETNSKLITALLSSLNDPNEYVRRKALESLEKQKLSRNQKVIAELSKLLKDKNDVIKKDSARVLLKLNPTNEEAIKTLVELLEHKNLTVEVAKILEKQDNNLLKPYSQHLQELLKKMKEEAIQKLILKIEQSK